MRSATWSLIVRLLGLAALANTVVAVLIGRLHQPAPELRRLGSSGLVCVVRDYLLDRGEGPRFLDPATGRLVGLRVPEGEGLDYASLAPWRDERGATQAVGRWVRRRGQGHEQVGEGLGLARLRYPDGEVLDRVATDVLPSGAPCWLGGTGARVVFGAADGRLYRLDFEADPGSGEADDRPRRLSWDVEGLDPAELFVGDLSRPSDPRLADAHLAVAAVRRVRSADASDGHGFGLTEIWWLRLDPTGSEVVAAGALVRPGPGADEAERRFPTLASGPDGGLAVVYLARPEAGASWRLRIAPVASDAAGTLRESSPASDVRLADDCAASPPAVSPDGRWAWAIRRVTRPTTRRELGRFRLGPECWGRPGAGLADAGARAPAPGPH